MGQDYTTYNIPHSRNIVILPTLEGGNSIAPYTMRNHLNLFNSMLYSHQAYWPCPHPHHNQFCRPYSAIMTMTDTETTPPTSSNNGCQAHLLFRRWGHEARMQPSPPPQWEGRTQRGCFYMIQMSNTKQSSIRLSYSAIVWFRTTGDEPVASDALFALEIVAIKCKLLSRNENERRK